MVSADSVPGLIIRADADTQIGSGHLMRCLALAQAWQDRGGQVTFITACDSEELWTRLKREGFGLVPVDRPHPDPSDWETTSKVLKEQPSAWVVLDGYHFDPSYHLKIKDAGHPLLVIDDTAHLDRYHADIILNQNLHAQQLTYPCEPHTQLLLGTKYVLLRREFLAWQDWQREIPQVARKVLVTMGGGDPDNVTLKVIQALDELDVDGLEAAVVVGPSNPHLRGLETAARASRHSVRLVRNAVNMPELMAWADLAVSAAGSTCWELVFMGVPTLLVWVAANQRRVADSLAGAGAAIGLGPATELVMDELARKLMRFVGDPRERALVVRRGHALVDGGGATRAANALRGIRIELRPAQEEDVRLVWEWANDPATRTASFCTEPIAWDAHVAWFRSRLEDPNCLLFMALNSEGEPIGIIRFEIHGEEAEVSVNIAPESRNLGWGRQLLRSACTELFRRTEVHRVVGLVKKDNPRSQRAFIAAGFGVADEVVRRGQQALRFVLTRKGEF